MATNVHTLETPGSETNRTALLAPRVPPPGWRESLRSHWPEYVMETGLLGAFMVVAAAVGFVLEHPESPVRQALPTAFARRVLAGIAMGVTAVALVHSPWGKQSGAHMNPALTLAFVRLGKVARRDALFYTAAQFAGGCAGILFATLSIGPPLGHPAVNYVATVPGEAGVLAAWVAEAAISFVLMLVILYSSNSMRWSRLTPVLAGVLIATWIAFEAPLSGMSMNPARSFGSALPAGALGSLWVYFTAPPAGMMLAAEVFARLRGADAAWCAKLHHHNDKRCIFHCARPQGG